MARVTLIKPPNVLAMSSLSFNNTIPPLGLAYISASAKAAGHTVTVIDAPGEGIDRFEPLHHELFDSLFTHGLSLDEVVDRIDPESRVVGITNMFLHEWPLVRELVRLVRVRYPSVTIVLGGETPTAFWWKMLEDSPELDVCVLGEGEATFEELLATLEAGGPLEGVASIAFRGPDGPMKSTACRKRIRDIDELPWPDWESFQLEAYLANDYSSGVKRGRSIPMLSSRGCPFQCTFCSSPGMWTTRYVTRKPELVATEIEHYRSRYQVDNIDFLDLTSMLTKRWIVRFVEVLESRGIRMTWQLPSGTRSEALDAESLGALARSGCRNISYSPETGSTRLIQIIKKRAKLPVLTASVRAAVEAGVATNVDFILGLPSERWSDVWATYKYIVRLALAGAHSIAVMVFHPYPGSELFAELHRTGKIILDDEYYFGSLLRSARTRVSYSAIMGSKLLVLMQLVLLFTFYGLSYLVRPWRVVQMAYRLLTSARQETIMDQFLDTKVLYLKKRREVRARRESEGLPAEPA